MAYKVRMTARKSQIEGDLAEWEYQRLAHWKLMRAAWEEWQRLVREHKALGYDGPHPGGTEFEK